jgi:hypothetical protein
MIFRRGDGVNVKSLSGDGSYSHRKQPDRINLSIIQSNGRSWVIHYIEGRAENIVRIATTRRQRNRVDSFEIR